MKKRMDRKIVFRSVRVDKRELAEYVHRLRDAGLTWSSVADTLSGKGVSVSGQWRPWSAETARKFYTSHHPDPSIRPKRRDASGPRIVADCRGTERPCPWAACEFHLAHWFIHRGGKAASELSNQVESGDFSGMPATCVLDVTARGPMSNLELAEFFGLSRNRIWQIVHGALQSAARVDSKDGACAGFLRRAYEYSGNTAAQTQRREGGI
jgi:hypothetical protein